MFNNLEKITKIVKEQGQKFVDLDTSMIAIHNNFHTLEEKELALKEYLEMLELRKDTSEIKDVQILLLDMVKTLNKYEIGFMENLMHKKRIKYMQEFIKNEVKIVEDEEGNSFVDISNLPTDSVNEELREMAREQKDKLDKVDNANSNKKK